MLWEPQHSNSIEPAYIFLANICLAWTLLLEQAQQAPVLPEQAETSGTWGSVYRWYRDSMGRCSCRQQVYSVAKSCLTDSSKPHGLHARLPCPSSSPRVCPSWCPLHQWCCPTISSSVVPFSFCLQSFPASGSFPMSWLFASGGQSIRASASASAVAIAVPNLDLLRIWSSSMASRTEASFMHLVERVSYKLLHVGCYCWWNGASQVVLVVKNPPANPGDIRDISLVPRLGRSHGNPLQYSYLENAMDRGVWEATVHRVSKSQTWLKRLSMHALVGLLFDETILKAIKMGERFRLRSGGLLWFKNSACRNPSFRNPNVCTFIQEYSWESCL